SSTVKPAAASTTTTPSSASLPRPASTDGSRSRTAWTASTSCADRSPFSRRSGASTFDRLRSTSVAFMRPGPMRLVLAVALIPWLLACQGHAARTSAASSTPAGEADEPATYQAEVEEGLGAAVAILVDTSG